MYLNVAAYHCVDMSQVRKIALLVIVGLLMMIGYVANGLYLDAAKRLVVANARIQADELKIADFSKKIESLTTTTAAVMTVPSSVPDESAWKEFLALAATNTDMDVRVPDGSFVYSKLLSHDKQKLVYSVLKNCLKDEYVKTDTLFSQECFEYHVFEQDVKTQKVEELKVVANVAPFSKGGCGGVIVYMPFAWSKHDAKIVFDWNNLAQFGCDGFDPGPKYLIMDASGGPLMPIDRSSSEQLFLDDYADVVFTRYIKGSFSIDCQDGTQIYPTDIVMKNLETGKERVLMTAKIRGSVSENYYLSEYEQQLRHLGPNAMSFVYSVTNIDKSKTCVHSPLGSSEEIREFTVQDP